MTILKADKITWVGLNKPSKQDIDYLREHFPFESHTLAELMAPTLRPRVEEHDEYLYLVLHFPMFSDDLRVTVSRELDILVTKDSLITVSYDDIRPLKEFQLKCSSEGVHQAYCLGKSTAHLLYFLIETLFRFELRELDHVQQAIDEIETSLFLRKEEEMVSKISYVQRDLLAFRRTIKPQKIVLESLLHHGVAFFGKTATPLFRDMYGQYNKVWDVLENHRDSIEALHRTNESLLSIKTNQIMKLLTIFAVITFPLTLFASIFGMNTQYLPIIGHPYDFWIIIALMGCGVLGMITYFKYRKWI